MQRFGRQSKEDGPVPAANCGKDRVEADSDSDITLMLVAFFALGLDPSLFPLYRDSGGSRRRTDRIPPPTGVPTGSKLTRKIRIMKTTCRFWMSAQLPPRVRLVSPPSEIGQMTMMTTVES